MYKKCCNISTGHPTILMKIQVKLKLTVSTLSSLYHIKSQVLEYRDKITVPILSELTVSCTGG